MRTYIQALALSTTLLAFGGTAAFAQNGYGNQGGYQGGNGSQYDNDHWGRGPQGYANDYPEQGGPQFGARQGWQEGFRMGESDRQHGHSFRPTQLDEYKHIPSTPRGVNHDQFKNDYREGFVKGYSRGYGR